MKTESAERRPRLILPNKPELTAVERLRAPEYEFTEDYVGIGFFGRNGGGSSTLTSEISIATGAIYIDAGRSIREATGNDLTTIGFMDRNKDIDHSIDDQIMKELEVVREAKQKGRSAKPRAVAAKLIGYHARDLSDVFRVLVTVPRKMAIRRIRKRALEWWDETEAQADKQVASKKMHPQDAEFIHIIGASRRKVLTPKTVLREEREREEQDYAHWAKAYPDLKGIDIYNPGARLKGKKLYDFTLSTARRTKEENLAYLLAHLLKQGVIRPRSKS